MTAEIFQMQGPELEASTVGIRDSRDCQVTVSITKGYASPGGDLGFPCHQPFGHLLGPIFTYHLNTLQRVEVIYNEWHGKSSLTHEKRLGLVKAFQESDL